MTWPLQLGTLMRLQMQQHPPTQPVMGQRGEGKGRAALWGGHTEEGWASKKGSSLPHFSNICP